MHFLPDVYVPCEEGPAIIMKHWRLNIEQSIADVLDMTVDDAVNSLVLSLKFIRKW